jgi:CRISPR/Cas system endoribonuclease Cas6 (RAMP superfamily)
MNLERLFEEVLRETIREFEINPDHRAWFISSSYEVFGGFTHKKILEDNFKNDWELYRNQNMDEYSIQNIFEDRMIMMNYFKIGEINGEFYLSIRNFGSQEKDTIQGFIESLKKSKEYVIDESKIHISVISSDYQDTFTFKQVVNGKLHSI